ncbi:hypothetical protein WJX81_006075 [Elliptochloris bilobata]|uniref:N-acetyltransferase domain-containing protein n=1 Tax=Elliptochloris bilobata TaxID=381761 RepID=A0AAW1QXD9_9CHLO
MEPQLDCGVEWIDLESEELGCDQARWQHIGLACEGERMLGAVAVKRFGALRAAWMAASDWVLVDALAPAEALVDFVAVEPEARLRGVAEDNEGARRLIERCGFRAQ